MNKLTLIIPVKNEKESLPKVLEELSKYDCTKDNYFEVSDIAHPCAWRGIQ